MNFDIIECITDAHYSKAIKCTQDYMSWLGIDLSFQNIEKEFAEFAKMYGLPHGAFLLAMVGGEVAGGVGMRRFDEGRCEMKRMYVYDKFRGAGIGKALAEAIVQRARTLGYKDMLLDTVARLREANALYENLGFVNIAPYRENPDPTARYMRLTL